MILYLLIKNVKITILFHFHYLRKYYPVISRNINEFRNIKMKNLFQLRFVVNFIVQIFSSHY